MMKSNCKWALCVAGLVGFAGVLPGSAELPTLSEREWLGYFVAFQNKKFQFTMTGQGKAAIKVLNEKGATVNQKLTVPVEFLVEEILPNGKVTAKSIKPDSLESAQEATQKPQNVVIKGKVTGDATFEIHLHEDRGVISVGGRLLDPGTLTKNPLRFSIRMKFPNAYPSTPGGEDERDKEKAIKDKMKGDRIQLTWTDGKRLRQDTDKEVDAGSKELNGPGIAALQVEFSSYAEKKFEFTASQNSSLALSGDQTAPLHQGFDITWSADPAKDPEGKARLALEVK